MENIIGKWKHRNKKMITTYQKTLFLSSQNLPAIICVYVFLCFFELLSLCATEVGVVLCLLFCVWENMGVRVCMRKKRVFAKRGLRRWLKKAVVMASLLMVAPSSYKKRKFEERERERESESKPNWWFGWWFTLWFALAKQKPLLDITKSSYIFHFPSKEQGA